MRYLMWLFFIWGLYPESFHRLPLTGPCDLVTALQDAAPEWELGGHSGFLVPADSLAI
jgi:hypothetical protein